MRNIKDWKDILMISLTILSVAIPIWIWRSDGSSKAVTITLLSQTPIVPPTSKSVNGIEVTYKGEKISDLYLSLIEIKNTGSKSISSSDVESPIQIKLETPSKLRAATVTKKYPNGFDPKIEFSESAVTLQPSLMNPEDMVTVAVMSSDKEPVFLAAGRIFGVSDLAITPIKPSTFSRFINWGYLLVALAFFTISMIAVDGIINKNGVLLNRRSAVLISLLSLVVGSGLVTAHCKNFGHESFLFPLGYLIVLTFFSIFSSIWLNRQSSKSQSQDMES